MTPVAFPLLQSWKPDNAGVTTEARPKGAPPTREAMERDGAWLGTQTFIRDGKVDEKKVPRGALNLPADPNAQSVSFVVKIGARTLVRDRGKVLWVQNKHRHIIVTTCRIIHANGLEGRELRSILIFLPPVETKDSDMMLILSSGR